MSLNRINRGFAFLAFLVFLIFFIFAMTLNSSVSAWHPADPECSDPACVDPARSGAQKAFDFVCAMANNDFAGADSMCMTAMRKALGKSGTAKLWEALTSSMGFPKAMPADAAFRILDWTPVVQKVTSEGKKEISVTVSDVYPFPLKCMTIVRGTFEKGDVDFTVVTVDQGSGDIESNAADIEKSDGFTNSGVGAFFWRPVPAAPASQSEETPPPSYADAASFIEKDFRVGPQADLDGTLTLPKNLTRPFPAVVLVHGSGAHDRDETIMGNKPFRDIAHGLASMGIAVLRYEKRTYGRPAQSTVLASTMTLDTETVDDAADAMVRLSEHPSIDPDRIWLLGHSLGGYAAPRIVKRAMDRDGNCAGVVLMAAASLPLETAILRQYAYIFDICNAISDPSGETGNAEKTIPGNQDSGWTEEQKNHISGLMEAVALVRGRELAIDPPPAHKLPLAIPAAYWLNLRNYRPANELAGFDLPVLLLAGEKDYQVTSRDVAGWLAALKWKNNYRVVTVPEVGHTFIPSGPGAGSPADYEVRGNVDFRAVKAIANFILER